MRSAGSLLLVLVATSLLGACGDCAGVGAPSFEITVRDSRTGHPLTDSVTIAVLRVSDQVPLRGYPDVVGTGRFLFEEKRGTFDVIVERPGYYPWVSNARRVKGDCTIETVHITASMIPRST